MFHERPLSMAQLHTRTVQAYGLPIFSDQNEYTVQEYPTVCG